MSENIGPQIFLLKHALPVLVDSVPPREWRLGESGRQQSGELAKHFEILNIRHILTSPEPKAFETATLIGNDLGLQPMTVEGLQEIDIPVRPILTKAEHVTAHQKTYDFPAEPAIGVESAVAARNRFSKSLLEALKSIPIDDNVLVVSHGTVISLFTGDEDYQKSFSIWKRLACLSYVRLRRQDYSLMDVIEDPLGPGRE
jgi:2,3-bisphosphoglycerate-dependent phosphoglycerate mutase